MKILGVIGSLKLFGHWSIGLVGERKKINRRYGGSEASHIFAVVSGFNLYVGLLYSDFIKEQWHRFCFYIT